jgi:xylose isomerase
MAFAGYAARLNSFKIDNDGYWKGLNGTPTTLDLVRRAATVKGLTAVDLNFPDHLEGYNEKELIAACRECGIALNGFAMRYYSGNLFKLGAFTHPDPNIRRKAIDLTKRGLDTLANVDGTLMTLWMGQDGFDYSFQIDYDAAWDHTLFAYAEICDHNPAINISIEYKPNEPRAFSLMPDIATTLLAIKDINRSNLGVTLDFAHVLYADEMPAYAAALVGRHSQLLGVHLNDGYSKRDDGLIAGSVHPIQTIELLYTLHHLNYQGILYFDTFPDTAGLDPVSECHTNISAVEMLNKVAKSLGTHPALSEAIKRQDAAASQKLVMEAMYHTNRNLS